MFEYYLPNKNEDATVSLNSKFHELNKGFSAFAAFAWWLGSLRPGATRLVGFRGWCLDLFGSTTSRIALQGEEFWSCFSSGVGLLAVR